MNHDKVFKSWSELINIAETGESDYIGERSSRRTRDLEWSSLGSTFEETITLARSGWKDGTKRIKQELDILYAHVPSRRVKKELRYAPVGPGTMNMAKYISGHPKPYQVWKNTEIESNKGKATGRIIPITFNIVASGGISADEMFQKGSMVCALVDLIERSGRRVELILRAATGNENILRVQTTIKQAGDPLDIDRLAFALAHPGSLRRIIFSHLEQFSKEDRKKTGCDDGEHGYGKPHEWESTDGIYIPMSMYGDRNPEKRIEWIKAELAKLGIEID
jgi:hypothetical protein